MPWIRTVRLLSSCWFFFSYSICYIFRYVTITRLCPPFSCSIQLCIMYRYFKCIYILVISLYGGGGGLTKYIILSYIPCILHVYIGTWSSFIGALETRFTKGEYSCRYYIGNVLLSLVEVWYTSYIILL